MNEWMIEVWGGAWNKNASPSIEKDYGISQGYYYFTKEKAKNKFLEIIDMPIYSNQGIARDIKYGEMTHKRTIFVGKYEYVGSKNIARVRAKRQQEYYKALQNLMRVLVVGAVKGEEFEKKSEAYLEQTTKVDGQLGGMAAKIGADVQNAKLAARYLELLLAEMRFNSMVEINSWNDKFKNTKKDVTKFNLDDYIYKKKSLQDTVNNKLQDTISGWQGF